MAQTKVKHTPGPWEVWPNHDLGLDREDEIAVGIEGRVVVTVWPQGDDEVGIHEAVTNARLIAAAPDLLQALQAVADYWAGGDVPQDIDTAMRAAIAKATGEVS